MIKLRQKKGNRFVENYLYTRSEIDVLVEDTVQRNMVLAWENIPNKPDVLDDVSGAINTAIDEALVDYYTKLEIDDIEAGLNDAIDGKVTLDQFYQNVKLNSTDGLLVEGFSGTDQVGRINLRGSGQTSDGIDFAGIHIQKWNGAAFETNFFADLDGNLFLKGTLQPGSILVGDTTEGVFIDETLGLLVQGPNARVLINAVDTISQDVSFAGINIQALEGTDWVSNFYADPDGNITVRGTIEAFGGLILGGMVLDGDGAFTNVSGDFIINKDGLLFSVPDDFITPERSLVWDNGTNQSLIGAYNSNPPLNDAMTTRYESDAHVFRADGTQNLVFGASVNNFLKPIQLPGYNETQRNAISAFAGYIIYNTTTGRPNYHDGVEWKNF